MKAKNKLWASVLCLLMVVLFAIGFSACGGKGACSHQWGDWTVATQATCTEAGVQKRKCSKCGETETSVIDALGHDWEDATCATPKTCKVCAVTEGAALGHAYTLCTQTNEALKSGATCLSGPVYYMSCACGAISTNDEDIFTLDIVLDHKDDNHDHLCDYGCGKNDMGTHADSDTDNDHVCDYGCGVVLENCSDVDTDNDHACDICGKENVTGHAYVETSSTPATCTAAATKTYTCNCGDTYTEDVGSALGHNITGVTPVERLVGGCEYVLVYTCATCHEEVIGETVYKHNYVASISTPATCSAEGEKTYKCKDCGDTSKAAETIPADETGHNWTIGDVENGVRTDTCSICGTTKTVIVSDGNSASSNASDFANADVQLKVDDNTNANIQLGQGVADAIGDKNITISAGVVDEDALKEMGINENQLEQIGTNTVYDFNIKDGNDTAISDFGEDNYVTITLPYTLSEGEDIDSIAVWFISDTCQVEDCDKGENCVDAHKLVSIQATYNNGFVTFKTNHFSVYTVTRLTPAERCALYGHGYVCQHVAGNCTKDSYDLFVCVRCHDKYVDNLVKADGHDYTPETHAATCTEGGYVLYSCKDCDHSYRTKLNATGHAWSVEESKEATCVADGYTKYGCDNCDEEYTQVFVKLPHDYTDTVVPATCTTGGYTMHDCENCEYSYTDTYVAALGHAYAPSTWAWAADYSSATLTLVCENDNQHAVELEATITKSVVNGACSSFVKTTYTATVSYEGTNYNDEKVIESGTPEHSFSSDWTKDEKSHWHECVCGEKTDVTEHTFENATITKEPTCKEAGESTAYCVCGAIKVTAIPVTENHNYVDGVCTVCGAETVSYYINLVNSWKNIHGFALKIQNFSLEITSQDDDLLDSIKLVGSIKQVDIAELALYVEEGKLGGAATGKIEIFNGPFANATASYEFDAVIDGDYVYIYVHYGVEGTAGETIRLKVSVDSVLQSIMGNVGMGKEKEVMSNVGDTYTALDVVLEFCKDTLIPLMDSVVENNPAGYNAVFEKLLNVVFTFEQQGDGSYVATLDFEKLNALNTNLATKAVAEVLDEYFGEGTFATLVGKVKEILSLEIPNIPTYLDEKGIDSDVLFAGINALAVQMGAEEGFDVAALINNEQLAGVTLGMLLFKTEDDSYIEMIDSYAGMLQELSLYALFASDVTAIQDIVSGVLDMISESFEISFSTTSSGMLTSLNVSADGFVFEREDSSYSLVFDLSILINEKIDVTWGDIIGDINDSIVAPEEGLPEKNSVIDQYYYETSGTLSFQDTEYEYYGFHIFASVLQVDANSVMITPDCQDWEKYEIFGCVTEYGIVMAAIEDEEFAFIIDSYNGVVVKCIPTEDGYKAVFEDGTEKEVVFDVEGVSAEDYIRAYIELYFAIFENPEGRFPSFEKCCSYYYNSKTKEYAYESQHAYVEEGELLGESCTDGYKEITRCEHCDYYEEYTSYNHNTVTREEINLQEYGACYGELVYFSCACGQEQNVYLINACDGSTSSNEYYDEEHRLIHVDVHSCSDCGLRYTRSYYTVKNHENCTLTYYYTTVINVGETLVIEKEYTNVQTNHDYTITATLIGGVGSSCNDGVVITYTCKDCGYEYSNETSYHETYEKERIDLNSVCGGYVTVYGCACGQKSGLSRHSLCDLDYQSCPIWIEDAISGEQYSIDGWNKFINSAGIYTCAVTDPTACAYKIRYASYWLKDATTCMAYRYETWQLGYNVENGTYDREVTFKTGSSRIYHNYVDGSTDNHTKYDCADCGSYYYSNRYYDGDNNLAKHEILISNTLDNGYNKYREEIEEYATDADGNRYVSRRYNKLIYADNSEYWSEELRTERAYTDKPFGDYGRKVKSSFNDSNGESYSEECAYVYYKGYQFTIYIHRVEGDSWYKYDYTYTFDNGCVQKEVYTNSKGEREENTQNICGFWKSVTIKNPTCSQDGLECKECVVCGKRSESYTVEPHDHNWAQITDDWYVCITCGLENSNGASGAIIMEDLTKTYGEDEYYVVGYYARNNVAFSQYVSLILADESEVIISGIDFITIDGIRAFAFSKAAVEAWATENRYTDYFVKFSFVPDGSDGSFDYGITFTETTVETGAIMGEVLFKDYVGAGETKSYTITPIEDGEWVFTSLANDDTYATLYNEDGSVLVYDDDDGEGTNFQITYELTAGETYTIQVKWYRSDVAGYMPLFFAPIAVVA